jgi:hypothetical protein
LVNTIPRRYPPNIDLQTKRMIEGIYNALDDLMNRPMTPALSAAQLATVSQQAATQAVGLLGPFAQPVLGQSTADPKLSGISTSAGTVTSVTVSAGTNLTGGGTITSTGSVTLNLSANPSITTIIVNGATVRSGNGSPETVVTGSVGDIFLRKDGGAVTTLYVKESGAATNTGWIAK